MGLIVLLWSGIQTDLWIHKILWPKAASVRKHKLPVRKKTQIPLPQLNPLPHYFGLKRLSTNFHFSQDQAVEE